MNYLEISIAEHCNLNCKYCSHFSPIAKPIFADVNETKNGVLLLKKLIGDDIKDIRVLGGEPLLHPELVKFCTMLREHFLRSRIAVVTNGILLSKLSSDVLTEFNNNNIEIIITKYPIKLDEDELEHIKKLYGLKISYTNRSKTIKKMNHMPLDLNGTQNINDNFKICYSARCTNLKGTKIYPCPIVASIEHFNSYFSVELPVSNNDYLDLQKCKTKKQITDFLSKPIPFCAYCKRNEITYNLPWQISTKHIKEWT